MIKHDEYKNNLKLYEDYNLENNHAHIHGCAVTSIAVGKNIGVAPKADLYFIASKFMEEDGTLNFKYTAKAIDRVLKINKALPKEKKIRVISISTGFLPGEKGYKEVMNAISRAKKQNIFVVSSSLIETHGMVFNGLGRDVLDNPDNISSYKPGLLWKSKFYSTEYTDFVKRIYNKEPNQILLVPMDSISTASPTGKNDYIFNRRGGLSLFHIYQEYMH